MWPHQTPELEKLSSAVLDTLSERQMVNVENIKLVIVVIDI